jgi:hypothetical protein
MSACRFRTSRRLSIAGFPRFPDAEPLPTAIAEPPRPSTSAAGGGAFVRPPCWNVAGAEDDDMPDFSLPWATMKAAKPLPQPPVLPIAVAWPTRIDEN